MGLPLARFTEKSARGRSGRTLWFAGVGMEEGGWHKWAGLSVLSPIAENWLTLFYKEHVVSLHVVEAYTPDVRRMKVTFTGLAGWSC